MTPAGFQVFGYEDGRLSWSWDAKYIAFVGRWGNKEHVGTVEVATGKITQVTKTPAGKPALDGCYNPHWYDKYLFYFCGDGFYRRDMDSGQSKFLGSFYPKFEESRPSANAANVFFSYSTTSAPPHIVRIQHYTGDQADLGPGTDPGTWGATLPLIP